MFHRTLANGFFVFGMIALFLSAYGWSVTDIWLASTQWLLVSVVSILIAIYTRISAEDDEAIMEERAKSKTKTRKTARKKGPKHVSFKLSDE